MQSINKSIYLMSWGGQQGPNRQEVQFSEVIQIKFCTGPVLSCHVLPMLGACLPLLHGAVDCHDYEHNICCKHLNLCMCVSLCT